MKDEKPVRIEARLMTPAELADYLHIGQRTVQKLTAEGLIPVIRVGSKLARYDAEAVLAALKERRSGGKGETTAETLGV